jgi:Pvc16 N-terminal domain
MVLAAVSGGIRRILWNSFAADAAVRPLVGTEEAIVFLNPTQTARDSGNRVSLWLYFIAENEFTKNTAPRRVADDREQFPPLTLDLYYLLTPFGPSGEADLLILGRAMQGQAGALRQRAHDVDQQTGAGSRRPEHQPVPAHPRRTEPGLGGVAGALPAVSVLPGHGYPGRQHPHDKGSPGARDVW